MLNKLAELSVSKRADYGDTIVKSLEKSGFIVVKECDTLTDNHYIIAAADENCPDCGTNTKCACYDCKWLHIEGLSHCTIHEGCWGDCRCADFEARSE